MVRRRAFRTGAVRVLLLLGATGAWAAPKLPENLAPKAKVSASSEYSDRYLAKFAVDGKVPPAGSQSDLGKAWAVQGNTAADKAEFTLGWKQPVTVAEIVYYARTAWLMGECWKNYEVYADDAAEPIAKGRFKRIHGPQRIAMGPVKVRAIRLKFLGSYNGMNPGASEIQVFADSPSDGALKAFVKSQGGALPFEESGELAKQVAEGRLGFDKLIFIKRHELRPSHVYTRHCEGFRPGGGLYVLSPPKPGGNLTELVASPEGQILDVDLSYDGREVLFSWRRNKSAGYHIFRMNVEAGSPGNLRQVTDGPWHDYNACWLPDGGIAFISTRLPRGALCFTTPGGVLHRMDGDGNNVRRLSANYVDDFSPAVMPDGRILYSRWEYVDKPAIPIQSLWTIRPDGRQLQVFYGNAVLSPASFLDARPVPGTHSIMCVLTAHNGPIRGGVGIIENGRGVDAPEAMTNLTPEVRIGPPDRGSGNHVRGPYEQPNPIDAKRFLVSRNGVLLLWEMGTGVATMQASADGLGCYDGTPVVARRTPPVLLGYEEPQRAEADADAESLLEQGEATVYLVDVYRGLEPYVERGSVKAILVVEEVPKLFRTQTRGFGFQTPVISCGATYAAKKVWGTAKVEADGSAYFKVPTGRALYFIAVDERGVGVQRMRSFTHFTPGETQGCIGCHEPRSTAPPAARKAAAIRRGLLPLEPPSWGVTGFDYARHVQPVLDRHCAKCHAGLEPNGGVDLSADKTEWFNVSYDTLTGRYVNWIDTRNGREANILQITPNTWGSPKSRLAEIILSGHPDKDGKPCVALTGDERTRILTWIDLNVPYYGTYDMADERRLGGRRLYPKGLDKALQDVHKRRCASCHKGVAGKERWVRVTKPERNAFLVAPLAKAAGGHGACKGEVFASTGDPDYRMLLRAFEPIAELIKDHPRMDMDGAVPDDRVNRSKI